MMQFRVGIGYDIHRLIRGRKLVLGGINIPYSKGLHGHSDADVLLHAICDALLGAITKGDIGELFPNADPKYRNISSLKLLQKVYKLVKQSGYKINNVDTVVIADAPHLTLFKAKMISKISKVLRLKKNEINIKATTQEGLGIIGSKNAIAAYAVAALVKK